MTTPQLLQRAKYGDPEAIAQLMNQSLSPRGIQATVSRQSDCLQVLLESANEMNQPLLTQFVQNGIQNLNIPTIKTIEVVGRSQSKLDQPWRKILTLSPSSVQSPTDQPVTEPLPPQPTAGASSLPQPPQPPPAPRTAELDDPTLATAALDDDFSLDEELSMADIDQIVADAVKEVTTKIQSEIPYEPGDGLEDLSATEALPSPDPSPNIPMDAMIQQAMERGQLDELIDQELTMSDTVATVESNSPEDEFTGDRTFGNIDLSAEQPPASFHQVITPLPESENDIALAEQENPLTEPLDNPHSEAETSSTLLDDPPASNLLLALVSLIMVSATVGLLGYSLSNYSSNLRQFFANPWASIAGQTDEASETETAEKEDNHSVDTSTSETSNAPDADDSTSDEFPTTAPENPSSSDVNLSATSTASDADSTTLSDGETNLSNIGNGDNGSTDAQDASRSTPESVPESTSESGGGAIATCPTVIISSGQTVTLSQMAIDNQTQADTDVYPITGCLTNHTNTPIISAAINYLGPPENRSTEQGEGQGQLKFDTIEPKTTEPFTVQFPVAKETDIISVVSIAWRVEGSNEAEVLPLEFSLPLPQN